MTRALRDPRWLGGLAVAVVFAVVCVLLAQWQLDRRVQRAGHNAAVLENYDAAPVGLADALAALPAAGPTPEQQWTPVRLAGRYDPEGTVLVRNRPQSDTNGYQVAVPFDTRLPGGEDLRVLLVRGFVPSGSEADGPASLPPPPAGEVEVVARLRSGESPATRSAPAGQTYRLDLPALLADGGPALETAYGVVATEDGSPPAGMATIARPDTDPGPHLAYGVQWYLFALTGLVIWGVLARRHGIEGRLEREQGRAPRDEWVYEPGR
ncbi:SURF1 family protein [Aquipuribacter hungaricus]|uniref:SURF1-like protein n=1 Tax=Aquipuribacter hungaricus TaxID=545624 RepID=A0ABV7WCM0_9MICO